MIFFNFLNQRLVRGHINASNSFTDADFTTSHFFGSCFYKCSKSSLAYFGLCFFEGRTCPITSPSFLGDGHPWPQSVERIRLTEPLKRKERESDKSTAFRRRKQVRKKALSGRTARLRLFWFSFFRGAPSAGRARRIEAMDGRPS